MSRARSFRISKRADRTVVGHDLKRLNFQRSIIREDGAIVYFKPRYRDRSRLAAAVHHQSSVL
jgi:hypothetical protein